MQQIIQRLLSTSKPQPATHPVFQCTSAGCNYPNNYYGDQHCKTLRGPVVVS